MNPNCFRNLSLSSKSNFLWSEGEHILSRIADGYYIKLYTIYGFYVEVYYKPPEMQIERISVLDSRKALDNYTDHIQLPGEIINF
ncbi:MAG: hypothetical protein ACNS62_16665 [Candidatus Cyclobacteriaceae bacterium M3_2C_046]